MPELQLQLKADHKAKLRQRIFITIICETEFVLCSYNYIHKIRFTLPFRCLWLWPWSRVKDLFLTRTIKYSVPLQEEIKC